MACISVCSGRINYGCPAPASCPRFRDPSLLFDRAAKQVPWGLSPDRRQAAARDHL